MGSESSKITGSKDPAKPKNKKISVPTRKQSVNTGRVTLPPTIKIATSISCTNGFLVNG